MHIKSIVAGTAIALASTAGSAFAAEPFATLGVVPVEALTTATMDEVRAANIFLTVLHSDGPALVVGRTITTNVKGTIVIDSGTTPTTHDVQVPSQ